MQVRDLIAGSLRLIGAIASGENPQAAEFADALNSLNGMLESWSTDGLLVYTTNREVFPLVPSKQSYTMGPLGDFNTSRPVQISEASVQQNGIELPIDILNLQEWAEITLKTTPSTLPQCIYSEGTFPLETINVWPIPTVANNLVLYSLKPIASFASINDVVSLPPGYSRAIRYNLALELAPEFGREPSALVGVAASESKADIQRQNTEPVYMKSDAIGLSNSKSYNYLTGR